MNKPCNGFKFVTNGYYGGTIWQVIDQCEEDPEMIYIQAVDCPEAITGFEIKKLWDGIEEGFYVIA